MSIRNIEIKPGDIIINKSAIIMHEVFYTNEINRKKVNFDNIIKDSYSYIIDFIGKKGFVVDVQKNTLKILVRFEESQGDVYTILEDKHLVSWF